MNINLLYPQGKTKAFSMSWDDGFEFDARLIEMMEAYGLKGTFNLNSALMGEVSDIGEGKFGRRLTAQEARRLYVPHGMEVAVHGANHENLCSMSRDEALWQILSDRKALEDICGAPVHGMAYPYGVYSPAVIDILKDAGIYHCRTLDNNYNFCTPTDWLRLATTCHICDEQLWDTFDRFVGEQPRRGPFFGCIWGHSYELYTYDMWDKLEDLFGRVSGMRDTWYATLTDIYRYIQAFKSLDFTCAGDACYNPSAVDVWAMWNGQISVFPAGKTVFAP